MLQRHIKIIEKSRSSRESFGIAKALLSTCPSRIRDEVNISLSGPSRCCCISQDVGPVIDLSQRVLNNPTQRLLVGRRNPFLVFYVMSAMSNYATLNRSAYSIIITTPLCMPPKYSDRSATIEVDRLLSARLAGAATPTHSAGRPHPCARPRPSCDWKTLPCGNN
jgi:hypothetical protein